MNLPDEKGTYILIAAVARMQRIEIGRLGRFDIIPGFFAYVGSACGPGGLHARIAHHLESVAAPHWHIDHLLACAVPVEVWFAVSDRKLERDWAGLLEAAPSFRQPIPRFGSSDYHRSRTSHLFYAKRRPSFRWFEQRVREEFAPGIKPRQCVFAPASASGPAPQADAAPEAVDPRKQIVYCKH